MISTIYLDMDGVLSNFNKRYHELFNMSGDNVHPDAWASNWGTFIEGKHFETLEFFPNANLILGYVAATGIKTEILSSTGGPDYFEEISAQKRKWLDRWGIKYHANFVPGKKFKSEFATEHRLLIDDQPGIIEKFKAAGGHGVVHSGDADLTILTVHAILEEQGYKRYVAS